MLAPECDIKETRLKVLALPVLHHGGQNSWHRSEEVTSLSPYVLAPLCLRDSGRDAQYYEMPTIIYRLKNTVIPVYRGIS